MVEIINFAKLWVKYSDARNGHILMSLVWMAMFVWQSVSGGEYGNVFAFVSLWHVIVSNREAKEGS